jgi:hypothetical protein
VSNQLTQGIGRVGGASVWELVPSAHEWWQALRYVLIVFTFVVALTLAGSFVPYDGVITSGHPWLPRIHCHGCILCGMTRSFCAMAYGDWSAAWRWNHGGPILYFLGWMWLLGATFMTGCHFKRILIKKGSVNKGDYDKRSNGSSYVPITMATQVSRDTQANR